VSKTLHLNRFCLQANAQQAVSAGHYVTNQALPPALMWQNSSSDQLAAVCGWCVATRVIAARLSKKNTRKARPLGHLCFPPCWSLSFEKKTKVYFTIALCVCGKSQIYLSLINSAVAANLRGEALYPRNQSLFLQNCSDSCAQNFPLIKVVLYPRQSPSCVESNSGPSPSACVSR